MVCTFYSFKGGVGRSMALANVAELLYRRGMKVLMIDFDLEAPGLERFFECPGVATPPTTVHSRRGVIDMLLSYKRLRSLPLLSPPRSDSLPGTPSETTFPFPVEPLTEFIVPIYPENECGGSLALIPAGRRPRGEYPVYAQHVRSFDWDEFHSRWDGQRFFEWFRLEAEKAMGGKDAVILVDSRTGITEMSGVCTHQLADVVVLCVATNQQNLDGTLMMAQSLSNRQLVEEARKGRSLSLLFLPCRVEIAEREEHDKYAKEFDGLFGKYASRQLDLRESAFTYLKVPYVPYYAYMENVAVREQQRASAADMVKAFENLCAALAQVEPERNPLHRSYYPVYDTERPRVFLSYKRGVEPDESVAKEILESLRKRCDLFVDQTLLVGTQWAKRIETELRRAKFLIPLLSTHSVQSEMMEAVIATAHQIASQQDGLPAIVPVRIAYREPFQYPMSHYLNPLQAAFWDRKEDIPTLTEALMQAVLSGQVPRSGSGASTTSTHMLTSPEKLPVPLAMAQPKDLEMPEGTMDARSIFYVERPGDAVATATILTQNGATVTIKGPRQIGKSSLLIRVLHAAAQIGKRTVFLDFELVDRPTLTDADLFFITFCRWLTDELEMEDRTDEFWKIPLGNTQRCTRYMERYLFRQLDGPLVLAMDEVEGILDADFSSDFFGMLRNWHNSRSRAAVWRRLDIVLVTSTEPYQLIDNLNQSPFNVGEVIEIGDFTQEQVADLNSRHGSPLDAAAESHLTELLNGHPYLVRRALYLVASGCMSVQDLFANAASDQGPFADHLRYNLFRLRDKEDLVQGLLQVIRDQTCPDERVFYRLRGAGLVRREGNTVLPRCQLYATFFRTYLDG